MIDAKRALAGVVAFCAVWPALSGEAKADVHDLELSVPVALMDRSTAASGVPAGYGYENTTGLSTGLDARLYFENGSDYFHFGVALGAQHQAGSFLGLVDGYAYRTTLMEAGLAARAILPCLSRGDVKWRLGGVLALVGAHADAGMGVGGRDNGPDYEERAAASAALDHGGLGWRLGFDLSWHIESFLVGVGLGARQYFAFEGPVSRVWLMDLGLRIGGRFDLFPSPESHYTEA